MRARDRRVLLPAKQPPRQPSEPTGAGIFYDPLNRDPAILVAPLDGVIIAPALSEQPAIAVDIEAFPLFEIIRVGEPQLTTSPGWPDQTDPIAVS